MKVGEQDGGGAVAGTTPETPALPVTLPDSAFPSEQFLCPSCGQMLGPGTRVCPICKKVINPADISKAALPAHSVIVQNERVPAQPRESVRYPWRILLAVMAVGMSIGLISFALLGEQRGGVVVRTLPILVGSWVFFDAFRRRIPRPFRWSMGTMLLLAIVFPWYLARRNRPDATVPFVEADTRPVTRILFILLLLLFVLGLIFGVRQGQQANPKPDANTGGGPKSRVAQRISPVILDRS